MKINLEINNKNIKPLKLGISLTEGCNLHCSICNTMNERKWEIPESAVQEIIRYMPSLKYIQWLGGEAFLSKYFEELFDRASAYPDLQQSVNTNGLLITKEWAKKLVKNNVKLDLSIHGITKKTYENIHCGGNFEDLIGKLEWLKENRTEKIADKKRNMKMDFIVSMNFVIMKSNYREIDKVMDFAQKYKIDIVQFSELLDDAPKNVFIQENINENRKINEYIESIMTEVIKKAEAFEIMFYNRFINAKAAKKEECKRALDPLHSNAEKSGQGVFCYVPWQSMFIIAGGSVKPDCICQQNIGNINDSSLEEIWNGSAMQAYRNNIAKNQYHNFCSQGCLHGKRPENFLGYEVLESAAE